MVFGKGRGMDSTKILLKFQQNFGGENEITQIRICSEDSPCYSHSYRVTDPIRISLLENEDKKIYSDTTF